MIEYRQTAPVKNNIVTVTLPKDFHYKQVNVVITPVDDDNCLSFNKIDFKPINLKGNEPDYSSKILRQERDLR